MDNSVSSTERNLQTRSRETAIDASAVGANSSQTNPTQANPSQANPSQTYAKGLMDELFNDLDGLLDGTLVPPSEPLKVEEPKARTPINLDFATFLSTHPSIAASPGLAASLSANGLSANGLANGVSVDGMPELLSIPEDTVELPQSKAEIARHEARQSSYGLFEKMLIFVGCSSAVAAVMIMLGSQGVLGRVLTALKVGSTSPVASVPVNPSDAKFADYMGKTLEAIDTKVKSTQPGANVLPLNLSIPGTSMLPTVKIPGNPSGKASGSASGPSIVIGGMPRPVTPGTVAGTAAKVSNNLSGSVPMNVPGNAVMNPVQNDLNQAVSKLSSLVDRLSGGVSRPSVVAPIAAVPVARQVPAVSQAPAPARTLKAVMELGSQSAILFEMNGVSQRYEKGENIGSSGWVVVKIENGSAIVRRNGEVRTLSVGQKI